MRRVLLAVLLLATSLPAAPVPAGAADSWIARRVARPEQVERLKSRRLRAPLPMRPEEVRALAAREGRWRTFRDVITAPGGDWSRDPGRRRTWQAPMRDARGPRRARPAAMGAAVAAPPETIRIAVLRIDFRADRGGAASTGNGHFDLSGPDSAAIPIDPAPHDRLFFEKHMEALSRYYNAQSYGRYVIQADVWPRTPNGAYSLSDMADYGPWKFSQEIYRAAVHLFRDMFFAADSQATAMHDPIPWDSYNAFDVVHAGGDLQTDVRQDSPEDIPSFTLTVGDTDMVVFPDSTNRPIDRASILPETQAQDGYFGAINGVLAHENGHNIFGLADLYNVSTGYPVVGYWSLMDSGNLVGARVTLKTGEEIYATGLMPPSVDPWQRAFVNDTLAYPEVDYGAGSMAIANSERNPDVRRATLSSDEYLLFENRWIAPGDTLRFDQDSTTHVILGPLSPDPYEYDALLPGGGILAWHVDDSVIPWSTSLRINPDYGINTNPDRLGVSVLEADGLMDLGDPGSPFFLGAPFDPWFLSDNPVLSDSTFPPLQTHTGTKPHMRFSFLDDPDPVMHFAAARAWQRAGWPVVADFPPGGPLLLAVDADGDGKDEVCWAGGRDSLDALVDGRPARVANPDSAALFALRPDGTGLGGGAQAFAHLPRRPRPEIAALARGDSGAVFAVSTYGADTTNGGGRVYLIDAQGNVMPGWPAALPSAVTTPPVFAGHTVLVGDAAGAVRQLDLNGRLLWAWPVDLDHSPVVGRLAVAPPSAGIVLAFAAASAEGRVAWLGLKMVSSPDSGPSPDFGVTSSAFGPAGWSPDFLLLPLDGAAGSSPSAACGAGKYALVVHDADKLWAFCAETGDPIPGWGHTFGDTIVAGLGAGDPDGDGLPEVLIQTARSGLAFVNRSGWPSPGWPKRGTDEDFRTDSPPLALDVDGDHRSEVVAMNASGIVAALRADGKVPEGWPLASGSGAVGSPVADDLDRDGLLDLVVPDRLGRLFAYALPVPASDPVATSWRMLGGDPQRTSALPLIATPPAPATPAGPLAAGSLKAYPNPARRKPVHFAFRLTEPASVEVRVLDTSGHEVASFRREGFQGENVQEWDPGALPAGLYLARLKFQAGGRERTEILQVGLLR